MKDEPENDYAMRISDAMDIIKQMSPDEIKQLIESNPLYNYLLRMDKRYDIFEEEE